MTLQAGGQGAAEKQKTKRRKEPGAQPRHGQQQGDPRTVDSGASSSQSPPTGAPIVAYCRVCDRPITIDDDVTPTGSDPIADLAAGLPAVAAVFSEHLAAMEKTVNSDSFALATGGLLPVSGIGIDSGGGGNIGGEGGVDARKAQEEGGVEGDGGRGDRERCGEGEGKEEGERGDGAEGGGEGDVEAEVLRLQQEHRLLNQHLQQRQQQIQQLQALHVKLESLMLPAQNEAPAGGAGGMGGVGSEEEGSEGESDGEGREQTQGLVLCARCRQAGLELAKATGLILSDDPMEWPGQPPPSIMAPWAPLPEIPRDRPLPPPAHAFSLSEQSQNRPPPPIFLPPPLPFARIANAEQSTPPPQGAMSGFDISDQTRGGNLPLLDPLPPIDPMAVMPCKCDECRKAVELYGTSPLPDGNLGYLNETGYAGQNSGELGTDGGGSVGYSDGTGRDDDWYDVEGDLWWMVRRYVRAIYRQPPGADVLMDPVEAIEGPGTGFTFPREGGSETEGDQAAWVIYMQDVVMELLREDPERLVHFLLRDAKDWMEEERSKLASLLAEATQSPQPAVPSPEQQASQSNAPVAAADAPVAMEQPITLTENTPAVLPSNQTPSLTASVLEPALGGNNQQPNIAAVARFFGGLLNTYSSLCIAMEKFKLLLPPLMDEEFVRLFEMTWGDLNKCLFVEFVFSDAVVEENLPPFIKYLRANGSGSNATGSAGGANANANVKDSGASVSGKRPNNAAAAAGTSSGNVGNTDTAVGKENTGGVGESGEGNSGTGAGGGVGGGGGAEARTAVLHDQVLAEYEKFDREMGALRARWKQMRLLLEQFDSRAVFGSPPPHPSSLPQSPDLPSIGSLPLGPLSSTLPSGPGQDSGYPRSWQKYGGRLADPETPILAYDWTRHDQSVPWPTPEAIVTQGPPAPRQVPPLVASTQPQQRIPPIQQPLPASQQPFQGQAPPLPRAGTQPPPPAPKASNLVPGPPGAPQGRVGGPAPAPPPSQTARPGPVSGGPPAPRPVAQPQYLQTPPGPDCGCPQCVATYGPQSTAGGSAAGAASAAAAAPLGPGQQRQGYPLPTQPGALPPPGGLPAPVQNQPPPLAGAGKGGPRVNNKKLKGAAKRQLKEQQAAAAAAANPPLPPVMSDPNYGLPPPAAPPLGPTMGPPPVTAVAGGVGVPPSPLGSRYSDFMSCAVCLQQYATAMQGGAGPTYVPPPCTHQPRSPAPLPASVPPHTATRAPPLQQQPQPPQQQPPIAVFTPAPPGGYPPVPAHAMPGGGPGYPPGPLACECESCQRATSLLATKRHPPGQCTLPGCPTCLAAYPGHPPAPAPPPLSSYPTQNPPFDPYLNSSQQPLPPVAASPVGNPGARYAAGPPVPNMQGGGPVPNPPMRPAPQPGPADYDQGEDSGGDEYDDDSEGDDYEGTCGNDPAGGEGGTPCTQRECPHCHKHGYNNGGAPAPKSNHDSGAMRKKLQQRLQQEKARKEKLAQEEEERRRRAEAASKQAHVAPVDDLLQYIEGQKSKPRPQEVAEKGAESKRAKRLRKKQEKQKPGADGGDGEEYEEPPPPSPFIEDEPPQIPTTSNVNAGPAAVATTAPVQKGKKKGQAISVPVDATTPQQEATQTPGANGAKNKSPAGANEKQAVNAATQPAGKKASASPTQAAGDVSSSQPAGVRRQSSTSNAAAAVAVAVGANNATTGKGENGDKRKEEQGVSGSKGMAKTEEPPPAQKQNSKTAAAPTPQQQASKHQGTAPNTSNTAKGPTGKQQNTKHQAKAQPTPANTQTKGSGGKPGEVKTQLSNGPITTTTTATSQTQPPPTQSTNAKNPPSASTQQSAKGNGKLSNPPSSEDGNGRKGSGGSLLRLPGGANDKKMGAAFTSLDDIFTPLDDLDGLDGDVDREVEEFKRFCSNLHSNPPAERMKIAVTINLGALKSKFKLKS